MLIKTCDPSHWFSTPAAGTLLTRQRCPQCSAGKIRFLPDSPDLLQRCKRCMGQQQRRLDSGRCIPGRTRPSRPPTYISETLGRPARPAQPIREQNVREEGCVQGWLEDKVMCVFKKGIRWMYGIHSG